MRKKRKKQMILLGIIFLLILAGGINFFSVRRDALTRFSSYEDKVKTIETSYGKLSFIDEGQGEVILSCHGICGGYDQGYDTLDGKKESYRILAPSRFGYPGSDMPDNATIEKQVEAYVELLDYLKIDKVYVLATSAGGTSAIKFALMYPERTKGLILYCSGYPRLTKPEKETTYAGPPAFLCNDFAMWLISPLFKPIMGMEQDTLKSIMPMKDKKAGVVFDAKTTNTVMNNNYQEYDLSKLEVPVLMIHSKDDKLANFKGVEPWIDKIKDCTFLPLEGGGHLMEGHGAEIGNALDKFILKTK
jgi:pimeloyl-ACP methyl ester carboxylesterase